MLKRDHRPRVLGMPIGRRPRHSMPGAGWAGAGVVAAAATVPLAQRATKALAHGRDMAGTAGRAVDTAGRAVDTARSFEDAVSSHSTTIGKFGAVIGEVRKLGRSDGDGKPRLAHLIEEHTDIGAPREVVYNQWTQLEMFPAIAKGVESVNQQEDDRAEWTSKIGPVRRHWEARITEQRPDELIAWQAERGPRHEGVVSFHSLDDQLTRVLVQIQYKPSGPLETVGNTLRIQRRRVRRDLRLFKHFVELSGEETGAWRGRIGDDSGDTEQDSGQKRGRSGGRDGPEAAGSQHSGGDDADRDTDDDKAPRSRSRSGQSRSSGTNGSGRTRQSASSGRSAPSSRSASSGKRPSATKSSARTPAKSPARSNGSSGNGRSRAGGAGSSAAGSRRGRS